MPTSTIDRKIVVLCQFYKYVQEMTAFVFEEKMIFYTRVFRDYLIKKKLKTFSSKPNVKNFRSTISSSHL